MFDKYAISLTSVRWKLILKKYNSGIGKGRR